MLQLDLTAPAPAPTPPQTLGTGTPLTHRARCLRSVPSPTWGLTRVWGARTSLTTGMAWQHIDTIQGAVRKTTVAAIDIPAHADVPMRHNSPQGHTLTLSGLPRPLAVGDRFSLWLRFEQAGEVEVKVVVQQPKDTPAAKTAHAD